MFCSKCGKEIPNEAAFCQHCGAACTADKANNQPSRQEMMHKLKRFKKLKNCTCLECGYQGLMGVVRDRELTRKEKAFFLVCRILAFVVAFMLFIPQGLLRGFILGFAISGIFWFIEERYKKKILFCPCCDTEAVEI